MKSKTVEDQKKPSNSAARRGRRSIINVERARVLSTDQVNKIVEDTFSNPAPKFDVASLTSDVNLTLLSLFNSFDKERHFYSQRMKRLQNQLLRIEKITKEQRFLLAVAGRNYNRRQKPICRYPSFDYDKMLFSFGNDVKPDPAGQVPSDAIEEKIKEFFQLSGEFLQWLPNNEAHRVLSYLKPVSADDLICELLPSILTRNCRGRISRPISQARTIKFIAAVLQHSGIRQENSRGSVPEMVARRLSRRKKRRSKK